MYSRQLFCSMYSNPLAHISETVLTCRYCTYICVLIFTYIRTYVRHSTTLVYCSMYVRMSTVHSVCICIHVYVHMYVCMYVCVYVLVRHFTQLGVLYTLCLQTVHTSVVSRSFLKATKPFLGPKVPFILT